MTSAPKNIVLCCDGTNNQLHEHYSNVAKIRRLLVTDERQLVFYDPGVGTGAHPGLVLPASQQVFRALGLAVGYGFNTNLEEAYTFLMEHYEEGDSIYLFGFSRGAFTARVLAGMLKRCGLLHPGNQSLVPYARRLYTQKRFAAAQRFKTSFSAREVQIEFLGLWDTVSSVGLALDRTYLDTRHNDIVRRVRHAMSIDERRAFFRPNRWTRLPQPHQDTVEMWFSGCHSDVGGGHTEHRPHSGLSKIALRWMVDEAKAANPTMPLRFRPEQERDLFERSGREYSEPDPSAPMHESLKGPWWPLELLLRRRRTFPWVATRMGRRRTIPEDDLVHDSVLQRLETVDGYAPPNLQSLLSKQHPRLASKEAERRSFPATLRLFAHIVGWTALALVLLVALLGVLAALLDLGVSALLGQSSTTPWRHVPYSWFAAGWHHAPRAVATAFFASLPLFVFRYASKEANMRSGISGNPRALTGPSPPHKRLGLLTARQLHAYLRYLGKKGRRQYRIYCWLDNLVALSYGAAFLALLWWMHSSLGVRVHQWWAVMPLVAVAADFTENVLLARLAGRYQPRRALSGPVTLLAGVATTVKILAFAGSVLLCIWAATFVFP